MLASPKPLWDNCLAVIRDAVKPDQYKTWFEPIVFESYKPATKTLLLRCPVPSSMSIWRLTMWTC